jgi:hypothetical protein
MVHTLSCPNDLCRSPSPNTDHFNSDGIYLSPQPPQQQMSDRNTFSLQPMLSPKHHVHSPLATSNRETSNNTRKRKINDVESAETRPRATKKPRNDLASSIFNSECASTLQGQVERASSETRGSSVQDDASTLMAFPHLVESTVSCLRSG